MKRNHLINIFIVIFAASSIIIFIIFSPSKKKKEIVIYDGKWNSIWVINQIAGYIIENGYKYKVIYFGTTEKEAIDGFSKGTIDFHLEAWNIASIAAFREEYERMMKAGNIIDLGEMFSGAGNYWIIPEWVSKKYNIRSVDDLKKHWKVFSNPDNLSKGVFYNFVNGWSITGINKVMLRGYGLDKIYDEVSFGTAEAEEKMFIRAQKKKNPILGYYWQPTYLMGKYNWYLIKHPPYDKKIWATIEKSNEDGTPLNKACGFPPEKISKYASSRVYENAPEITDMVQKMEFELKDLNSILVWGKENNVETEWEKAAIYYLKNYEVKWKQWVTHDAYIKIKKSLEKK